MRVERAYWRAALKSLADDQLLWLALRDATEDEVAALQEALELSDEDVAASRCGGCRSCARPASLGKASAVFRQPRDGRTPPAEACRATTLGAQDHT